MQSGLLRKLKKASGSALDHIGNTIKHKPVESYVVYFVSPKTQKKIAMQAYHDMGEAKQHLQEFKKRYGKYVQAGVEESVSDKTKDSAVQKFSSKERKLSTSIKKCRDKLKRK